MFVIFTLADLRCLRQVKAVPGALLDELEDNLRTVHRTDGGKTSRENFILGREKSPFTAILQPGDGPGIYELLPDGMPQARPDWVGPNDFGGTVTYHVIYLCEHDRALNLFIPIGTLSPTRRNDLEDNQ